MQLNTLLLSYYKDCNFCHSQTPFTILVTYYTNPDKLTKDLLILNSFMNNKTNPQLTDDAIRQEMSRVPISDISYLMYTEVQQWTSTKRKIQLWTSMVDVDG